MTAPLRAFARVRVAPRDPAQLSLPPADVVRALRDGFRGAAQDVRFLGVEGGAWLAEAVFAPRADRPEEALVARYGDEALWRTFVAAAYEAGLCDVLALEHLDAGRD